MSSPSVVSALSGRQIEIAGHGYRAVIASIGASVRRLQHQGRELVVGFDADAVRPNYRGTVLAPWPNRVVDGRYRFDDHDQQLALTEPTRGHALHGLVVWSDFAVTPHESSAVTLTTDIPAQQGYPHPVRVQVGYRLEPDGLHTEVTGTNLGRSDAPWGTGPHPYLVAGPGRVDDWELELPARQVMTVTPDRLVPVDVVPIPAGDAYDFSCARRIGATAIDHAFTDLDRDAAGVATVRLRAGTAGVELSWGPECPWVQVHTADLVPDDPGHRIGLAVEPMTCAPDAFNRPDRGLVRLAPGDHHTSSWRIGAIG